MSNDSKFKCYIAAYVILEKGSKSLLMRRYNTGYRDGFYSLVAGHFEGGETAKQCIIREAKEEIGVVLDEHQLDVVHVMHRLSGDREYINIFLRAREWDGKVENKEINKCDDLLWCDKDDLPMNIVPEVAQAFKNIVEGVYYSELGW